MRLSIELNRPSRPLLLDGRLADFRNESALRPKISARLTGCQRAFPKQRGPRPQPAAQAWSAGESADQANCPQMQLIPQAVRWQDWSITPDGVFTALAPYFTAP